MEKENKYLAYNKNYKRLGKKQPIQYFLCLRLIGKTIPSIYSDEYSTGFLFKLI